MRFVYVVDCRAECRHGLVREGPRLVQQRRQLFRSSFALFSADANVESSVTCAIWAAFAGDVEGDNAPAVIEGDAIDKGYDRRHNLFAADAHQLFLDVFAVFNPLNAQLIVNAKDNYAAAGICQGDDLLGDALGIGKLYFEFEKGVFTAAHQA